MSRTYKDRPVKLRFPESTYGFGNYAVVFLNEYIDPYTGQTIKYRDSRTYQLRGVKTKKPKALHTDHEWMSTPSWHTHLMMIRPERRKVRVLERKALVSDLETLDIPDTGNKPHIYYW